MMKVAIVHEWMIDYKGSERVVEQMLHCYPQADLFATVEFLPPEERFFLGGRTVRTSFIQRLPGARRRYQKYLPLMPLAVEQHDLSAYDLVISSSHAVAKGVLTGPDQLHLCYCYSPIRYAWDLQHQYLHESGLDRGLKGVLVGWLARWLLHRIRIWDVRTAQGVDAFAGISHYIARRIRKVYRREAVVIYPPVDVERFTPQGAKEDFYLCASRMTPYKRVDMVVEAFAGMPERRLVVIGDGPGWEKARAAARGAANIELLGFRDSDVLRDHMRRARAFVFAAEEDFGIAPLEAQACGTPVIAFGRGGALETVRGLDHKEPTGVFFSQQTPEALREAVELFEGSQDRITVQACRANAERFGVENFRSGFTGFVEKAWKNHLAQGANPQPASGEAE